MCCNFFPVLRPKEKSKNKTSKGNSHTFLAHIPIRLSSLGYLFCFLDRLAPHPPLYPAGSVESIAHALNRITQRQNARKYEARRPLVGALKAASQPSIVTDRTLSQESSQEQDGMDCDILAANSNNSNSREYMYVTPAPSYGTKVNRSYESTLAISGSSSMRRTSPFYPPTAQNAQLAVSQVTPISANTWTSAHDGTPNPSTPHIRQSFNKDHPSVSSLNNGKRVVTGMSADTAKRHYGSPASLDLLRRIQLHNKAISRYIEMQRQHQTPPPTSIHQSSSVSVNRGSHSHGHSDKKPPTPTSSDCHDYGTSASAPSFKFVVPCPPSTPKPNFMAGTQHRGVIRTAPVSMLSP